jgi:Transcription factor/nuclear export subunit protein 2
VAASVRAVLPAAVWDIIPVELYTTFWSLSLYDIHVPTES